MCTLWPILSFSWCFSHDWGIWKGAFLLGFSVVYYYVNSHCSHSLRQSVVKKPIGPNSSVWLIHFCQAGLKLGDWVKNIIRREKQAARSSKSSDTFHIYLLRTGYGRTIQHLISLPLHNVPATWILGDQELTWSNLRRRNVENTPALWGISHCNGLRFQSLLLDKAVAKFHCRNLGGFIMSKVGKMINYTNCIYILTYIN